MITGARLRGAATLATSIPDLRVLASQSGDAEIHRPTVSNLVEQLPGRTDAVSIYRVVTFPGDVARKGDDRAFSRNRPTGAVSTDRIAAESRRTRHTE